MYKQCFSLMVICLCLGCGKQAEHKLVKAKPAPVLQALEGGQLIWRTWAQRDSARVLNKPILLFLYGQRSFWCRDLAARCFNDKELARAIERIAWPIMVDIDRQPDVFKRFNLGGVPSVAFLKPNEEWISGGTYFDPEDLMDLLRRVSFPFENPDRMRSLEIQRTELHRRSRLWEAKNPRPAVAPSNVLLAQVLDSLSVAVAQGVDVGTEGALLLFEARESVRGITQWLLSRRDTDGAFFLYAHTSDGHIVDREKHLGVNGALLSTLAKASKKNEDIAKASIALGDALLTHFLVDSLFCAGFAGFEVAGEVPRDLSVYSGWNGLTISGLAALYRATDAFRFRQGAIQAMDVLVNQFRQADGFFRHSDDDLTDVLLEDQAFIARAALDLFEITEDVKYLQLARQLADGMLAQFASETGALRERKAPEDPLYVVRDGWLPSGNGVAAQVYVQLKKHTGEEKYQEAARRILQALMGPNVDHVASMGALGRALNMHLSEIHLEQ